MSWEGEESTVGQRGPKSVGRWHTKKNSCSHEPRGVTEMELFFGTVGNEPKDAEDARGDNALANARSVC